MRASEATCSVCGSVRSSQPKIPDKKQAHVLGPELQALQAQMNGGSTIKTDGYWQWHLHGNQVSAIPFATSELSDHRLIRETEEMPAAISGVPPVTKTGST